MAEKADDTLARTTLNRMVGISDFTSSTVEGVLKSPRGVLVLGQMIVGHLELPARGALLERWLAHDLADAMLEVGQTSGTAKTAAQNRVVDRIRRLNRRFGGAGNAMTATSSDADITRAAARRSLLEVLKELECLPAADEFPDVDDTLQPLDDPLDPGGET